MRRPVVSLVAAVALLLAAAVPVLSLESAPRDQHAARPFESKQGFLLLNREFPGRRPNRFASPSRATRLAESAAVESSAALGAVRSSARRRPRRAPTSLVLLTVPVAGDSVSSDAVAAVRELRDDVSPATLAGSGARRSSAAQRPRTSTTTTSWTRGCRSCSSSSSASASSCSIAFRSIVVPATAIAMNLLSVGAAYGLLVLVFVEGVGNELFGFQQVDIIEAWVPLFLFAVLFGLSMDYQVFLLSRIRERYSQTGDNDDAISFGVGSTARLITGAALIIIAVFAGFARATWSCSSRWASGSPSRSSSTRPSSAPWSCRRR